MKVATILCVLSICICLCVAQVSYDSTWESLDARPIPEWFDEAKFGILIHWGVYSVPSITGEKFWNLWKKGDPEIGSFMQDNYPPKFTYQGFARDFTAELFNPNKWLSLFEKSGAKYVILTAKHHDGYTLWPSSYSFSWNSKDVGPDRDLLGEFVNAVRKTSMKFGLYYSLLEWFHPQYISDTKSKFTKNDFVLHKVLPEMMEMVNIYQPDILWSGGDWQANDTYWKSKEFLAWLYNESPVKDTVLVNDGWGNGTECSHGGYFVCHNFSAIKTHKWEKAVKMDKLSWGYRRNVNYEDFHTVKELIRELAQTVSRGGNLLLNVGPTSDGSIDLLSQDRLLNLGRWLSVNGDAIYGTHPWTHQKDLRGDVWYTSSNSSVYAIVLDWPSNNNLFLRSAKSLFTENVTRITLLGNSEHLKWEPVNDAIKITFPDKATVKSDFSWTLEIQNSG